MSEPSIYFQVLAPTQKLAADRRALLKEKIRASARPDAPISCLSASVRSSLFSRGSPKNLTESPPPLGLEYPPIPPLSVWLYIEREIDSVGKTKLRVEDIQLFVANHYGTRLSEMCSASRCAEVTWSRQVAMFLAKCLMPNYSLPSLGRKFGGRDHTTVLHAYRKIEALVREDEDLAGEIDLIARSLSDHFIMPAGVGL